MGCFHCNKTIISENINQIKFPDSNHDGKEIIDNHLQNPLSINKYENNNNALIKNNIDIKHQKFNIDNNKIQINIQKTDKKKDIFDKNMIDNIIKNEVMKAKLKFEEQEKNDKLKIQQLETIIANQNKPILVGLSNIGATCYMNASLQCLSNTKKLTDFFLYNFKNNDSNKIMSNEYYKVLLNLWKRENNHKSYSPYSFKEVLSNQNSLFAGIQANDSKDLINFLIEKFHQELNIINNNKIINNNILNNPDQTNEQMMLESFLQDFKINFNSPISSYFYGILETKSQCQGCNIIKFNFQIYSFVEFPLQQVNQYFFNQGKNLIFSSVSSNGKNPDVNLYECFEYNRKIDTMTGDNQMYCNNCNKLCNAFYSTLLYSGPRYLIINLNRGKGAVYECKVIFPKQLNIYNYLTYKDGITVYELYAVICHLGPSSMSGHFVAYCRNRIDNKWYLYNDGIVSLCKREAQYNDGMPYILFYRSAISDT